MATREEELKILDKLEKSLDRISDKYEKGKYWLDGNRIFNYECEHDKASDIFGVSQRTYDASPHAYDVITFKYDPQTGEPSSVTGYDFRINVVFYFSLKTFPTTIDEEGKKVNGLKDGFWKFFRKGELIASGNYKKGVREGEWIFKGWKDRRFVSDCLKGTYKNGSSVGLWSCSTGTKIYFKNGRMDRDKILELFIEQDQPL